MNIKCYNTRSHSSILHFSILYIFLFLFPHFHLFFLMTSLGYCNVMNYFNGSYTVISYSYGFMEIMSFFFFQSPDIITSHIPLSDITNPSWALSILVFCSSRHFHVHHSSLSSVRPAGQVHVKLRVRRPP